jgi:hypothetical protein
MGFLDSDRGTRITIAVVCPISDVQLKIPRKLFKLWRDFLFFDWGFKCFYAYQFFMF